MSIVARFFPNGEFSQGVDTSYRRLKHVCNKRKISAFDPGSMQISGRPYTQEDLNRCNEQNADIPSQVYAAKGYLFLSTGGTEYRLLEFDNEKTVLCATSGFKAGEVVHIATSIYRLVHTKLLKPLVHQSVESCDIPTSRKKLEAMTKPMARNIRNGVYLLEQQPGGKDLLSFLTLTLPNLSSDGLAKCCENWDSMVKQFMDWLRLTLRRKHIEFQYVYCTEIQTKRLEIRHEYAPHLHLVFKGRNGKKEPWAITPKQARKAWKRCIADVVTECFRDDALENIQRIKHSAARYLGKYLSKGRCCIPSGAEGNAIVSLRTQWGGMSRGISQRIRQCTQRLGGSYEASRVVAGILGNMEELLRQGLVSYFKRGYIALGIDEVTGLGRGLHVGVGCLRTPTYQGGLVPVISLVSRILDGVPD